MARAQITLNVTGGSVRPLGGPAYVVPANVGQIHDNNLFHSFNEFNVKTGQTVRFTGPASIANIIGRVTGGKESSIDGVIETRNSMPSANLFILNPSGFVFHANAKLEVGGSFHASTADYLRFADDKQFFVDLSKHSSFKVVEPIAFGFLPRLPTDGRPPSLISVVGSTLTVDSGKTLSLIGRNVSVVNSTLQAPGGRVQLIGPGVSGAPLARRTPLDTEGSAIAITDSTLDSNADQAGAIIIRGGQLMVDGSSIFSKTRDGIGTPHAGIELSALGQITLTNTTSVESSIFGVGRAGDIVLAADRLDVINGASVTTNTNESSNGRGGDVTVRVNDFNLIGAALSTLTRSRSGEGAGGNLDVTAFGNAVIADLGTIGSASSSSAAAGNITAVFGSLSLTRLGLIQSGSFVLRTGHGGDVTVTAESMAISDGAGISSQGFPLDVNPVHVTARKQLLIDNGFISTSTKAAGDAGNITLDVGSLALNNGGQIASSSLESARGAGGDIKVTAADSITISGTSPTGRSPIQRPFQLNEVSSGIFTNAAGEGPGGDLNITVRQLELRGLSRISAKSTSASNAPAGNIDITFADTLRMDQSSIATSSKSANGGDIVIRSTGSTLFLNGSQITTSVERGGGDGGTITLGSPTHSLGFLVLSNSQVQADAFGGNGGHIAVFTDVYLKSPNSTVSAFSAQSTAGTIDIQARVTDVSGSLAELPGNLLQGANLLRSACAARSAEGTASSLVVAHREGVPPEPDGLLASPLGALLFSNLSSDARPDGEPFIQSAGAWIGSNCTQ